MLKKMYVSEIVGVLAVFLLCKADQEGAIYRTMRRERVCMLENGAGKLQIAKILAADFELSDAHKSFQNSCKVRSWWLNVMG